MTIAVGDKLPDVTIKTNGAKGPEDLSTGDFFKGRKVVLFAVPGAFTPGCSNTHMPGFVVNADEILEKADAIGCMAVNDAFVMGAWQDNQNAEKITMLADGNAEFTRALGLELDASGAGLGIRSKRFALIANDGVVEYLGVDAKGVEESSAETVLKHL
ncbi:MAG: peroxiredoxin [Alcanivorax sp.]|uniref:Glutathione-dependent peroxiredoxin n=1 Tax=Alloalcanivorax marinus TaxID=1177169 RepID=A0A9Q3UJ26_9GAMM|nr:peroxiredoxin [Alloalcanivorax marinus]MBM7332106.1 peroxiredoxin [Alloalcanivorax marinus]MCC4307360.1 peroxiredoxin [Alloalcanivorax marinus]MCH2556571.1 peroxiredoxin [Alcanivorax sp.]MCU5787186.1 AhpC/TSA family protein [Alloalcanivorax marinus]